MLSALPQLPLRSLLPRFDALLLDAYGVLVDHDQALPGAGELLAQLQRLKKPYFIVTNDASRLPESIARRLQGMGLEVGPEQIISSGTLLAPTFAELGLAGARCVVLGPEDSRQMVSAAGGRVVEPGQPAEVVVLCDEVGYPFVEAVDAVLTLLYRRLDGGQPTRLLLPNPDLVYPKSAGRYGFTAGSIALIFEAALQLRYPQRPELRFLPLGKPNRPIFEAARQRAGSDRLLMVGDQPATDIRGARAAGLTSALVTSGLHAPGAALPESDRPDYLITEL